MSGEEDEVEAGQLPLVDPRSHTACPQLAVASLLCQYSTTLPAIDSAGLHSHPLSLNSGPLEFGARASTCRSSLDSITRLARPTCHSLSLFPLPLLPLTQHSLARTMAPTLPQDPPGPRYRTQNYRGNARGLGKQDHPEGSSNYTLLQGCAPHSLFSHGKRADELGLGRAGSSGIRREGGSIMLGSLARRRSSARWASQPSGSLVRSIPSFPPSRPFPPSDRLTRVINPFAQPRRKQTGPTASDTQSTTSGTSANSTRRAGRQPSGARRTSCSSASRNSRRTVSPGAFRLDSCGVRYGGANETVYTCVRGQESSSTSVRPPSPSSHPSAPSAPPASLTLPRFARPQTQS